MSVKDYFNLNDSLNTSGPSKTLDELGREVESPEYVESHYNERDRFVPQVDFGEVSNFARYASAEQYYEDAISRIYRTYPYDGSKREKIDWHLSSSHFDKYIFDKEYPRTNGYAIFSAGGWGNKQAMVGGYGAPASSDYEYIQLKGGPHKDSDYPTLKTLPESFPGLHEGKANVYDADTRRKSNLAIDGDNGVSVEFWLKKEAFSPTANTENEVVFDLWNGELSSSSGYGRLTIELTGATSGTPFLVTMQSASSGFFQEFIGANITTGSLSTWNHLGFTFQNTGSNIQTKFYLNGNLNNTILTGSTVGEVTGSLIANIGALRTAPSGTTGATYDGVVEGYGKLSGSLDEFRYWTEKRTSKDVGRFWFTQINGGTNTDVAFSGSSTSKYDQDNPVNLGVYYKFNEGITGTSSIDSSVLDYSGRVTNGSWTGYVGSSSRNVGSAMVSASAALTEFKDPIIYSSHPDVSSLLTTLKESGSLHDERNNSSMYHTLPAWVTEEDEETGGIAKKLIQIVGSYFDTLHLQVESLSKVKDVDYASASFKTLPFTDRLIDNVGFISPDVFTQATNLENLASRDEDRDFKENLYETKRQIYKNIYNNLVYIYKSKGTEKSFRNLIRCFGVDDELVRLNLYADNTTHEIRDNFRTTSHRKKYVSFNHPQRFEATVYQTASSDADSVYSYISGSDTTTLNTSREFWIPWTIETEVIFPNKPEPGEPGYYSVSFVSSSLFGVHEAKDSSDDYTWATNDNNNFQVYAVREEAESKNAYFVLTSSITGWPTLTSSLYYDVYDNEKWNFAVRFYVDKTNNGGRVKGGIVNDIVSGSNNDVSAYVELYGVNTVLDSVQNEFHVSGVLTGYDLSNPVASATGPLNTVNTRLYLGAHRTNFTGAVLQKADSKISSLRYWKSYLSNDVVKAHARDASNFGTEHPYENVGLLKTSLANLDVPALDTLALHWDFDNVTGSDASGQFLVQDFSSGSVGSAARYGWFGDVVRSRHAGKGDNFPVSLTASVSNEYVYSAKQRLPDAITSDNMVSILSQDDEVYTRESRPINHFFAIEKSMYQTISEEMINFFATVVDFNNIIGEPVNRYRQDYKEMAKIRQLFYERIKNTPSLEKYIEFYKWIDNAISKMIYQLVPASANMSERLRNIVESHVLERNKYWTKYPTLEFKKREPEAGLRGITELTYDWEHGHAPLSNLQTNNCLWWDERAAATNAVITSGDSTIDSQRDTFNDADKHRSGSAPNLSSDTNTGYEGSTYAINRFTKPYKLNVHESLNIRGGANFHRNKKVDYVFNATEPFGDLAIVDGPFPGVELTASVNYLLVSSSFVEDLDPCRDVLIPNQKQKRDSNVRNSREYLTAGGYDFGKADHLLPFNMHSSSVTTGYINQVNNSSFITYLTNKIDFTNMHVDTYGADKEVPLQGPFTEKFVGGRQHRHVALNASSSRATTNGLDDQSNRSEGWYILFGDSEASFGVVGPTYTTTGEYDKDVPRATRMRDEFAKRPVNIRNIQQTTGSGLGNYESNWNLVSTVGRTQNNAYFKDNEGVSLPPLVADLPKTTHVHTLISVTADGEDCEGDCGNYFGVYIDDEGAFQGGRFVEQNEDEANIFTLPRRDLTGSNSVIVSRFSAPGGPEISSRGYLDIMAEEYSVHNALPFRNLSVRSSGSGEQGLIRMSIEGSTTKNEARDREGLRTRLTRHCGLHGFDSANGSPIASYHKVNRNPLKRIKET